MTIKEQTFRGRPFKVARGSLHPEFSLFTFEEEERDIREKYWGVGPGQVVVDVGASYGSYTLTACAMGATVYAFEPEKLVYDDLVKNLELNGWLFTSCFPFNVGLWNSPGRVNMKSYAPHWPSHTISGDYPMTTLDESVRNLKLDRVDWVKVDVEGAEEHVLYGALETIRRFHPKMLVECHVFLDAGLKERVVKLLSSVHDYTFKEIPRDPCVMVYARTARRLEDAKSN